MYFFPFLDFKMFRSKKYWKNVQTQKNVQSWIFLIFLKVQI
jgi:hypothetical protein